MVAEAHQWLRRGRPDRVWRTLDWLWTRQPLPGLYTQWEGWGEENGFGLRKQMRGWMRPPDVTPHNWSAAEMLLQLAMLAETQEGEDSDDLVIGAGVPAAWLSRRIAVSDIGTAAGFVDRTRNGREVAVTIHGAAVPVRLGPAFPAAAGVRAMAVGAPALPAEPASRAGGPRRQRPYAGRQAAPPHSVNRRPRLTGGCALSLRGQ